MDNSQQQQKQDDVDVMEVPEVHEDDLLIELLDASLAGENAAHHHQQLGSVADGDGDCWTDNQESYDIHARQDCEDCCGLDGMLSDFDDYDGGPPRLRSPPAPCHVVFGHDDTLEWAEEAADAAMDPFASESAGGWYMDGLVMAMAWEEPEDGGSGGGFPFEPCYYGGEAGAGQLYDASPLWE